jgi:hypothetical protein
LSSYTSAALQRCSAAPLPQGLQELWRRRVSRYHIPTAEDVYEGRSDRVNAMMCGMVETFALREARRRCGQSLPWLLAIVRLYGFDLLSINVSSPSGDADAGGDAGDDSGVRCSWRGVWADVCQCALCLLLVVHYFCGDVSQPAQMGPHGSPKPRADLGLVFSTPSNREQRAANVSYAVKLLVEAKVPVVLTAADMLNGAPDDDIMLLQVSSGWRRLSL